MVEKPHQATVEYFNAYLYHSILETHFSPLCSVCRQRLRIWAIWTYALFALVSDELRQTKDEIIIESKGTKFDLDKLQFDWSEAKHNENCKMHPHLDMDIHSPALWDKLAKLIKTSNKKAIVFMCRDDDIANINLAVSMKLNGPKQLKKATIFCRMFSETAQDLNEMLERRITESHSRDIVLFPLQKELKEAFREELFSQ